MKFANIIEYRFSFAFAFIVLSFVAVPARGQPKPGPQGAKRAAVPTQLPAMRRVVTKPPARSPGQYSVARLWNEAMLDAIRRDTPRPPIHARNLFHVSAAMYDAWAAYDPTAVGYFRVESPPGKPSQAKQEVAISYAAYRVLSHRFARSPGHTESQNQFDTLMRQLRQNPHNTNHQGFSPAAIGNRIGQAIIEFGLQDGANEQHDFADTSGYAPVNLPLIFNGIPADLLADINRWQPLWIPGSIAPQQFLAPHWGAVMPFALPEADSKGLYFDPGMPPLLGGDGHETVVADIIQLLAASNSLDPSDGQWINISPSVVGNHSLGAQDGNGHTVNPSTGEAYPENFVLQGDWGRVLAEFWADGPQSATPPGHWNEIANAVSDHPHVKKRISGFGPVVSDLQWDIKLYFALNAAVHDSAIATWGVKAYYDYGRPVSVIRDMAIRGQSSDKQLPNYDPLGLPLIPGLVELITHESSAHGERHEQLAAFVGECAVHAWRGHPDDPVNEFAGAGWILGSKWLPYQQQNFVTPPFAGYTSGHSGFSRAAAEVLTSFTGDPYFPGGIAQYLAMPVDGFELDFEYGPVQPVLLQWATYADAADEAGISRIYGGIHPALDDFPGRVIGARAGLNAFLLANEYFEGHGSENR